MASLYTHKKHGWQILYNLYFSDGSSSKKYKTTKIKQKAILMQKDIERLEVLSVNNKLTREDIIYCIHKKYVTKEEALKIFPETPMDTNGITWDTLRDVYMNHLKKVGSDTTRASYPYRLKAIMDYFKEFNPWELKENDIERFTFHCRDKEYQRATINNFITILRIMFDYLVREGIITDNPARKIKYLRVSDERIPRILFPDEFKRFLDGIKEHSYLLRGYFAEMMLTYLYTGMRRHELVKLKTENINLRNGIIIVKGKGDKERIIEIHPTLLPILKSVIAKNKGKGEYFFGGYNEPLVLDEGVSRAFSKFRKRVALPQGVKLHSLRHTFISYLLASGADLKYVQEQAGHSKISTTQKYIHLIPRGEQIIKVLDYEKFTKNS